MRRIDLFIALFLSLLFLGRPVHADVTGADQNASHSALSITEGSKTQEGRMTYTVKADHVEIAQLLKQLFEKTGEEYSIDQDVIGPVDLFIQNAPMDQVFQRITEAARPPILIVRGNGKFTRVSRKLEITADDIDKIKSIIGPPAVVPGTDLGPAIGGYPIEKQPLDRSVTLDIPDNHPISFGDALQLIGQQAHVRIQLHRSIPHDVAFSGQCSQASLRSVLDWIVKAGSLKWVAQPDGSILIAPTDHFQLMISEYMIGAFPPVLCPHCHQQIFPGWNYCPNCGQLAPRRAGASNSHRSP